MRHSEKRIESRKYLEDLIAICNGEIIMEHDDSENDFFDWLEGDGTGFYETSFSVN